MYRHTFPLHCTSANDQARKERTLQERPGKEEKAIQEGPGEERKGHSRRTMQIRKKRTLQEGPGKEETDSL